MNYKEIYEKAYNLQIDKLNKSIQTLLIKQKAENRSFSYADELIENYLKQERNDFLNLENTYLKLFEESYRAHEMNYELNFKSKVLYNELKDKYEEFKDSINLDYKEIIEALAKLNATKEMIRKYSSYSYNLRDMYKLSKFEGYKNFKTFDLIELGRIGNQALCNELYEINNPKPREANSSNIILNKDKFELKKLYESTFRDVEFYEDMINYYFDEESISHSEFIQLFVERKVLDHPIKFHCETNVATSFIYNLKERFYKRLSINYLLNNQKFKSFDDTSLTLANLSNSKSKNHSRDFASLSSKLLQYSL